MDYATGHLVPLRRYALALAEGPDEWIRAAEAHRVGNLVYGERLFEEQFLCLNAGFISERDKLTASMFLHHLLAARMHLAQAPFTGGEFPGCDSDVMQAKSTVAVHS